MDLDNDLLSLWLEARHLSTEEVRELIEEIQQHRNDLAEKDETLKEYEKNGTEEVTHEEDRKALRPRRHWYRP